MAFFRPGELKLLWPFYLDELLSPMLYFAPAYFVLYFKDLNLTYFQIGLLLAIAPFMTFLFEIPSGAFADIYGRKLSVLLGHAGQTLAFLALYFSSDYLFMLACFAVMGMASAFPSGAKEAWLIDLIKHKNKHLLHSYLSKSQMLGNFGLIVAGLLGVVFVKSFGLGIIWLFAAASVFISFLLLMLGEEHHIAKKVQFYESYSRILEQIKASIHYGYNHHVLYYIFVISIYLSIVFSLQSELSWTPVLLEAGLPDHSFGYLFSAMALMAMLSPLFTMKFLKPRKERNFIILSLCIQAFLAVYVGFVFGIYGLVSLILIERFFGSAKYPAESAYFHRFIPDNMRATIGSMLSMLLAISGVIAGPLSGYLIDLFGPRQMIVVSGILAIPAILLFFRIKEVKN